MSTHVGGVGASLRSLSNPNKALWTPRHCADVAALVGDVTGILCAREIYTYAGYSAKVCIYFVGACVLVIVTQLSMPRSDAMSISNTSSDCMTEVTLHPSLPPHDIHHRLHRLLPSSPYTHGAIYVPIRDVLESLGQQNSRSTLVLKPAEPPPPAPILLLRGEFKWRLGGEIEQSSSPPWSWMSEELCGKPYPYIARDLNSLSSTVDSTSTSRCPYTKIIQSDTHAAYQTVLAC